MFRKCALTVAVVFLFLQISELLALACPNRAPSVGKCVDLFAVCGNNPPYSTCTGTMEVVHNGLFRCEEPSKGNRCISGGPPAPCKTACACTDDTMNEGCKCDGPERQNFDSFTQVIQSCT